MTTEGGPPQLRTARTAKKAIARMTFSGFVTEGGLTSKGILASSSLNVDFGPLEPGTGAGAALSPNRDGPTPFPTAIVVVVGVPVHCEVSMSSRKVNPFAAPKEPFVAVEKGENLESVLPDL